MTGGFEPVDYHSSVRVDTFNELKVLLCLIWKIILLHRFEKNSRCSKQFKYYDKSQLEAMFGSIYSEANIYVFINYLQIILDLMPEPRITASAREPTCYNIIILDRETVRIGVI